MIESTQRMGALLLAFGLVATGLTASAARIVIGQVRYLPTGWTAPEVTANDDGTHSYKPSVPEGFEKRVVGAAVGIDQATTHPNLQPRTPASGAGAPADAARVVLRYPDGRTVQVKPGDRVVVGGEPWTVIGLVRGDFYLRSERTGASLKLVRHD
jgi:hypothetical protein